MRLLSKYLKKSSLLIGLAILIAFAGRFSMNYFSEAIKAYTESLIISYSKEIVDQGVSEGVIELLNGKSLLNEVYDNDGKVSYAYLDAQTINYLRSNISKYIADCINYINKGEDFKSIELPLGYFFGRNYFLSDGIKVPVNLEVVGHQDVEIEKKVETYGLNTTILQINLVVTLSIRSVIPFQTEIVESQSSIPIALEILNNDIPYYLGDILNN